MSLRGQKFELDLDADVFTPKPLSSPDAQPVFETSLIGEIRERNPTAPPALPKPKDSLTGFPAHKKRSNLSAFKQQRAAQDTKLAGGGRLQNQTSRPQIPVQNQPSDKAIAHHIGQKYGYNFDAKEKQEISEENKRRLEEMSAEDIDEARAELMSSLNPAFIEKLLRRANIDEKTDDDYPRPIVDDLKAESPPQASNPTPSERSKETTNHDLSSTITPSSQPSNNHHHQTPPIHFPPPPPIDPSTFTPLDPTSPTFLHDLQTHYFPNTPHDASSMTWLTDPSESETLESAYHPRHPAYAISALRFSFTGALIPPSESLLIPSDRGLHHHGLAPASAGYTVGELAILARSAMAAQRCIAYQILGRVMYRLGKGEFGEKGGELYEGLWGVVERERVVEIMMAEANRLAGGGHVSARAYAVEALWLWRKGGGGEGERGLPREGEVRAK